MLKITDGLGSPSYISAIVLLIASTLPVAEADEAEVRHPDGNTVHAFDVKPTAVTFSPDGLQLAAAAEDKTIHVWSLPDGKLRRNLAGHWHPPGALAFSNDGKLLGSVATSTARPGPEEFKLWDLANGEILHEMTEPEHHSANDGASPKPFVAVSPDGSLVVFPGKDRTVVIWEIAEKKSRPTNSLGLVPSAADFSPDGKTLALGTNTGESHGYVLTLMIDPNLPEKRDVKQAIYSGVMVLACSADGQTLFAGHVHRHTAVFRLSITGNPGDAAADRLIWEWKGSERIDALAFSATGGLLALRTNGTVEIWNTKAKEQIATIADAAGPLALSPDGSLLATCRGEGALQIVTVPK